MLRFRLALLFSATLCAQENYEIQVYPSETIPPKVTMVELHSNFTFEGTKNVVDGVRPTNHALHETLEITHGFNEWYETGFYIFTSADSTYGWQYVGSHIRPRVRVPPSWKWPVGVSLSQEIGYVRPAYSADTWTWEIRPIIDKEIGKLYLSFNPVLERSFHGPSTGRGVEFSPNFKAGYDITKRINAGFEYYGGLGPVTGFDALRNQGQLLVPAIDLNLGPKWEFNFGVGIGLTQGTDHLLVKMIIGRRFGIGKSKNSLATP
jgi:hypothetical protein